MNEKNEENWDEAIEDIRNGNTERFRDIILHYQGLIRFVAMYYFRGRPDQADEIVHMTFLRAYRGLDRFVPGRPLEPWLKQIARREALRALRALARKNAAYQELIQIELAKTRENRAAPVERTERLSECMARLKHFAKDLIEWHYFQGISLKDVARRLGRSPESLRITMMRIREQLRACLTGAVQS